MEHILNKKYSIDQTFVSWLKETKKQLNLHNLLEYGKKNEFITDIEYSFFVAIKTIRNKDDHELDLQLDNYLNASGLITAIGAIMKIDSNVYPYKQLKT